jgi:hypothetical protein
VRAISIFNVWRNSKKSSGASYGLGKDIVPR